MSFFLELVVASGAILAARYAGKAVEEAKKQNSIARFEKRLGIYHSLGKFRTVITTGGPAYPEDTLWEFESTAQLSEFYFPPEIFNEFARIGRFAIENRNLLDSSGAAPTSYTLSGPSPLQIATRANNNLRDDCIKLSEKVQLYLAELAGPAN